MDTSCRKELLWGFNNFGVCLYQNYGFEGKRPKKAAEKTIAENKDSRLSVRTLNLKVPDSTGHPYLSVSVTA